MIPLGVLAASAQSGFADLSGIRFYAGPPAGSNGSNISTWVDESVAGNSATTGTLKPTVITNATPNGASAVNFSANDTYLGGVPENGRSFRWSTAPFSGTDDGEMWLVLKRTGDDQGAWTFSTATLISHYTYGGIVADSFGGTVRFDAAGSTLNAWHVYRVRIVGPTLTATLDGSALFSGTTSKSWATTQRIGVSTNAVVAYGFRGYIAACVLRDRGSTTAEATIIRDHLNTVTGV